VSEIVVVKDYANEILEFKTISTWIIYKNMLRTLGVLHLPIMNHYSLHSPIRNVLLELGVFGSLVSIEKFTWDSSKTNCHFSRRL
jgi:hypothetical protein